MIKGIGFEHSTFKFPVGEMHVNVQNYNPWHAKAYGVVIEFNFERTEEVMELVLLVNALRHAGIKMIDLTMPYIPFARQDRVAVPGECFSLEAFADIINSLNFHNISVIDPHSDVATALIKNCQIISQEDVFSRYLSDKANYYLICPDGGAKKKINKLHDVGHVSLKCLGVIECSKVREPRTGAIKSTIVHADDLGGADCYIVDDICDAGGTFCAIAKELKKKNCGKIVLFVTHGFFTKGMQVFDGLIDEVYTKDGRVK